MHKVNPAVDAFETDDGLWHLTMLCGAVLPVVSDKRQRPWTHAIDRLVTCQGCVAKLQGGVRAVLGVHVRR